MATIDPVLVHPREAAAAQSRPAQEQAAPSYQAPQLFALGTVTELVQGYHGFYYDGGGHTDLP